MHKKSTQPKLPSNRSFGYFFAFIFGALGAYLRFQALPISSTVFVLLACILVITATFKSDWLLPFNRVWMRLGVLLSFIVSPIVMGIIYYGLFTPMALVMRLLRRDELRLKIKARRTNWKSKPKQVQDSSEFKNQF